MQDPLYRCHCSTEGCYCATIKRAEQKITALYNRYLERAGITRGQYALLVNIQNHPGISVSRLAEQMNLERTTLVRNLKPLENRRLIRDTAQSGRSRSLELTEEGKQVGQPLLPFGNRHSRSLSNRWEKSAPNCCCNCWKKSSPCKGRCASLPLSCRYSVLHLFNTCQSALENIPF